MSERVFSVLEKTLNYDFEFNDNKLNENDRLLETELYNITIFGINHVIAMGNMRTHPDNENLKYCVAYLIFKKKVICKVGIYEKLIDEEIGEEITKEDMDFTNLELIVDNYYYEEPYKLDAYVQTEDIIENVEDKEKDISKGIEEKSESSAEDMNDVEEKNESSEDTNEAVAEKKVSSSEDTNESAAEETTDETFSSLIEKLELDIYNEVDYENKDYTPIAIILSIYLTNIIKHVNNIADKEGNYNKNFADLKSIYTTMFSKEIISKDESIKKINRNELKNPVINEAFLIFLEHYLKVKIIILPDKNSEPVHFSVYGDIDKEKIKYNKKKMNDNFSNFNPETIIYITKDEDDNTYSLVKYKKLDELDKKEKDKLKSIFNKKNHEYFLKKQCTMIKNV
jgi:hypothetical protein